MECDNISGVNSCEDGTALIETIKHIVPNNDAEEESREQYYIVQNNGNEQQENVEVTDATSLCPMEQSEKRPALSDLCRVCATASDHLIPIFEGEGAEHELCSKIHKHLPIHITENDALPLHLCYHCAATLLAWHELAEGCLQAEHRLREMQNLLSDKQQAIVDTEKKDETYMKPACSDLDRCQTETDNVVQITTINLQDTKAEHIEYLECEECGSGFTDLRDLTDHLNTVHSDQVYYCAICKVAYRGTPNDFEEHESTHKNHIEKNINRQEEEFMENLPGYTCHLCGGTFASKKELKKHVNSHNDLKRNKVQNEDEMEALKKAKQVIDDRVVYNCEICQKHMLTKRGFLRHIRVHSGNRPCKCDFCGNCYRIEQDLARHIKDVHEGLKNYLCDICGRAFANKGARDDHRRIHTGERPYACEHCPKTFRTLNSIYIHNRVHTNYKPHKCSYCEKSFRSRQRLNNHLTTHTGVKAFPCEICGKSFSVKGEVIRHRAIHSQEKPFVCQNCGMKFGQKRYLRNHIKHHHKEQASLLLTDLTGEQI